MYQIKRELLEREAKHIQGFPGLIERQRIESMETQASAPVPKKTSKTSKAIESEPVADAGKKKAKTKKTVI
jgi:hypothetical protein